MPKPQSANEEIHDGILTHTVNLLRVAANQRRRVLSFLEALENKLAGDVQEIVGKSERAVARLGALLKQTRSTIATAYQGITEDQAGVLGRVAKAAAKDTVRLTNAALRVPLATVGQTDQQLVAIAGKTLINGRYPKEWWGAQSKALQDKFAAQMRLGMVQGEGMDQLVRRVRGTKAANYTDGLMQASKAQAEALVRTSVISVANESRVATILANPELNKALQWVATLDSRTTPICRALDGLRWTVPGLEPIGHSKAFPGPTAHWQCFTGDVPVSSPSGASVLYRRPYSGELVTIETDQGRRITATPNHPVATPAGWKAIGKINVGESLICEKGRGGRAAGNPKDQRRKTLFAELAQASAKLLRMRPVQVPVSAPDFHGDAADGEVGEVWAYGSLRDEGKAALAELLGQSDFQGRDFDISEPLAGSGVLELCLLCLRDPAHRRVGRGHAGLLSAVPSGAQVLAAAAGHASSPAPAQKGGEGDSELLRDLTRGHFVGGIELDRVRVISRREAVSVWVHNLETPAGFYFADGVASHNCRSTQVPVTKSWKELSRNPDLKTEGLQGAYEDILRAKMERAGMKPAAIDTVVAAQKDRFTGQGVPGTLTTGAWLEGKSAAEIDSLLGPGRGALYRAGKITLQDLTDQNNRPLTLAELEKLHSGPPPIPAPAFADMAGAQKYFSEHLGVPVIAKGIGWNADQEALWGKEFSTTPKAVEHATMIAESLRDVYTRFPQMPKTIQAVAVTDTDRARATHDGPTPWLSANPFEWQTREKSGIAAWEKANGRPWCSYELDKPIRPQVVRHELGHTRSVPAAEALAQAASDRLGPAWAKQNLGEYSASNVMEFMAESFCIFTRPSYVRGSLPADVEAFLQIMVGEK